jgi:hypothetical protein
MAILTQAQHYEVFVILSERLKPRLQPARRRRHRSAGLKISLSLDWSLY